MVYLACPETYDESADLAVLLNILDIPPDRFADIIGEEIKLVVIDGQWVPEVAAESARPHPAAATGEVPTIPDGEATGGPEGVINDGTAAVVRDEDGTRVVSATRPDEGSPTTRRETTTRTVEPITEKEGTNPYCYGVLGIGGLWTAVLFRLVTGFHVVPTAVTGFLFLHSPAPSRSSSTATSNTSRPTATGRHTSPGLSLRSSGWSTSSSSFTSTSVTRRCPPTSSCWPGAGSSTRTGQQTGTGERLLAQSSATTVSWVGLNSSTCSTSSTGRRCLRSFSMSAAPSSG